jgi:hypothetical protein
MRRERRSKSEATARAANAGAAASVSFREPIAEAQRLQSVAVLLDDIVLSSSFAHIIPFHAPEFDEHQGIRGRAHEPPRDKDGALCTMR